MSTLTPPVSTPKAVPVDFENLEVAFASKSNQDLTRAYWLFRAMGSNFLVQNGPRLLDTALALRLPVLPVIKATIFRHFCGGDDIADCNKTIKALFKSGIGSVLDYSVEGAESESHFEETCREILANINRAKGEPAIPFCVFKMTGIAAFNILEKASAGTISTEEEQKALSGIRDRVLRICTAAAQNDVRIFIDAEESWIQPAIDALADEMMEKFNRNRAIVFNTVQLYRTDRYEFSKASHRRAIKKGYKLGLKLVRGAYMEKERERAAQHGYPSPIQPTQETTNRDFDNTLEYCVEHRKDIEFCAGTHNEESCHLLLRLMALNNIPANDPGIWFSQLLGMSDHISYNLSAAGYNVAKYVPYGPVKSVLPYLIRRAQENTSIAGQTGRELRMISQEKKRRRI
jgi:proline dehydrogenase